MAHSLEHSPGLATAVTLLFDQGIANAAGMAAAAKMAAAQFNTDKHQIFTNHIIAVCGDGCMQV